MKTDSRNIPTLRPPLSFLIEDYNNLLAGILLDHQHDFRFIASSTLNRLEAQTHLYERIERFRQLSNFLEGGRSLELTGEDARYSTLLAERFPGQVSGSPFRRFSRIRFWAEWFLRLNYAVFLALVCRCFCRKPARARSFIRTYFDHRSVAKDGQLRDEYFGPFAVDLGKQQPLFVIFKLLRLSHLRLFLRAYRKTKVFQSALIEHFISLGELFLAHFQYASSRILLNGSYLYRGVEIAPLIQDSLDEDFYRFRGLVTYVERFVARRILGQMRPERLYYPFENQTWEKVYPLTKKALAASTKIIAFQHTGFSFKLLNHFPTAMDAQMPLFPDKILTVGELPRRELTRYGVFPCPVENGAALRHSHLETAGDFRLKPVSERRGSGVAYAFSYDRNKYREILKVLIESFGTSRVPVFLKIHPLFPEEEVMRELGVSLPANFVLAQKISWPAIYSQVGVVLYDDNSIGIEGLLFGVKTLMLDVGEPVYTVNRMFEFDLWDAVITPEQLPKLRQELETGVQPKELDVEKIGKYVQLYYTPYGAGKRYESLL